MRVARSKKNDVLDYDEPLLDISSLIDVCFLLLIFFLVTSTIQPRESDLSLRLPSAHIEWFERPLTMTVSVGKDGVVSLLDGKHVEILDSDVEQRELRGLQERLRFFEGMTEGDFFVKLKVSDDAQQQRFIDVVNCLAGEKIENVMMNWGY